MTVDEKIQRINEVLSRYFEKHANIEPVPAKEFMSDFIKEGVFASDKKNGLPIRELLRKLDAEKQLYQIPFVLPVRKQQNTNWFFAPAEFANDLANTKQEKFQAPTKVQKIRSKSRQHSDECYVLDLCDEVLQLHSIRQHKFPFLVGDPNQKGVCSQLPVDAWYKELNLVIEYNERQHSETVKFFDRRMTVSGITRGEQRLKYDRRKLEVLAQRDIQVLVLSYSDFQHTASKRLLRNKMVDLKVAKDKLQHYLSRIRP